MTRHLITLLLAMLHVMAFAGNDDSERRYRYYYIEAVNEQNKGNYENSFELFRRCQMLKPDAAETNFALGNYYLAFGLKELGLQLLKSAAAAEPQNSEFSERLARTYLYDNNATDAAEVYERLAKNSSDPSQYLGMLIRIYEKQHEYEKMLDALNRFEIQEGKSEDLTLSKMQVYSKLGNEEGAYNELKSLIDAHPFDMNLQVMLGNWLQSNGRNDEALETFTKVLREEPDNPQGQTSLMDFYRMKGDGHKADSLMVLLLTNPRTESDMRTSMLRSWARDIQGEKDDSIKIMNMFDRVLAMPQKLPEVMEMKAVYLAMKSASNSDKRRAWQELLEVQPDNIGARLSLIQCMWEDSIDENVVRECRKAVEYVPDEPLLYYYLSVAQQVNEHYDDARESIRKGLACVTRETPKEQVADLYNQLGDVLHFMGKKKEAYVAYDSCLVYNPDKIMCLNNYAYWLSVDGIELKKAEKMSYRTIVAEPNNVTYLDTYAWILYKQNRLDDARKYIEQALQSDTDSIVSEMHGDIYDHAGDIYYRLGMTEKAKEFWNKALIRGVDDDAVLRKKIKKGKLVK